MSTPRRDWPRSIGMPTTVTGGLELIAAVSKERPVDAARRRVPEMLVSPPRGDPRARRALQEPLLDEEGLVEVLDRAALLADRGGDRLDAGRTATILLDDRAQDLAVDLVEAVLVHLQQTERPPRRLGADGVVARHLREVAHPAQQAVGDARRAAAAARDLLGAVLVDGDPQQLRRAPDDGRQVPGLVEVEAVDDAEAGSQRRGDQA